MDIEAVAAKNPEAIHREEVDPQIGLVPFQARRVARGLGLKGDVAARAAKLVSALVAAYLDTDASLAEVNPLMITAQGEVMALDAKMNFDDNALFRHPDLVDMRDLGEENALEVEGSKFNLNYIKLDGNIGCMVNGAGLAMSTMDIIQLGGRRRPTSSTSAAGLGGGGRQGVPHPDRGPAIQGDPRQHLRRHPALRPVREGLVAALRALGGANLPIVVRLEGTNGDEGRAILREASSAS